jgi:hypothetical protein
MSQWITNPETGRLIKVGGPTFVRLKNKYQFDSAPTIELMPTIEKERAKPVRRQTVQPMTDPRLHQLMEMEAIKTSGRGSGYRTRGWGEDAPKKGSERHQLHRECGDRCFLIPETEGFPICPSCREGSCQCKIDCRGLTAAKIRAHQYKYTELYDLIDQLEKSKC